MNKQQHNANGFTLVELIIVIIILGALAAKVLPEFLEASKNARTTLVQNTHDAVLAGAQLAFSKCITEASCDNSQEISKPITGPKGVVGLLHFGYPTGKSRVPSFFGIKDWVKVSRGVIITEIGTSRTNFIIDGAPDPDHCKVLYREGLGFGPSPKITMSTSGC